MNRRKDMLYLSTQYYRPPFPKHKYWESDLDLIKEVGFNTIQLWVVWGWIEPSPGKFIFEDYDKLFEAAQKRGLKVLLSTCAELQPYWIHRDIPDSYMVDHMGNAVISSSRGESNEGITPGGCTDNPEVLKRMKIFLETIAERYKDHESLAGWDSWNELRWDTNADGLVCYCDHTINAFREWLKEKYGSLDGLNEAWQRRYSNFEDVYPGKVVGRPFTEMMEFQAFLQWKHAQHLKFRYETIRSIDKTHIISAHGPCPTFYSDWGPMVKYPTGGVTQPAIHRGSDWDMSEMVDIYGTSIFPVWQYNDMIEFGVKIECTRSATAQKKFWLSELQGGGGGVWGGLEKFLPVRAKEQQLWLWSSLSRGAKAVNFWCWRDEVFGNESSCCGLIGMDGYAKERLDLMKKSADLINRYNKLLEEYQPDSYEEQVGVYFDADIVNLEWAGTGEARRAFESILGYLVALETIQCRYTVIESNRLDSIDKLKVCILPLPLIIKPEVAKRLLDFVEKGGTLIIEGEAEAFTNLGFFNNIEDERSFTSGLGIKTQGRRNIPHDNFVVNFEDKEFQLKAGIFNTPLDLLVNGKEMEVLGKDLDGNNMVGKTKHGKGRVIAIGGFCGKSYYNERYPDFEQFLLQITTSSKVVTDITIESEFLIQWRSGLSDNKRLLFIMNSSKSQKVTVSAPAEFFKCNEVEELTSSSRVKLNNINGLKGFEILIEDESFAVISWIQK